MKKTKIAFMKGRGAKQEFIASLLEKTVDSAWKEAFH